MRDVEVFVMALELAMAIVVHDADVHPGAANDEWMIEYGYKNAHWFTRPSTRLTARAWTREEAIRDVMDASDGAYGRVSGWYLRVEALSICARWSCGKRFPKKTGRKYHSEHCQKADAKARQKRKRRARKKNAP